MDKILITGFEKFGDYKENVTEVLSEKIYRLANYSLEYMIFPVRIFSNGAEYYGRQIITKARQIKAKAIISLGMGPGIKGLRIEPQAMNWVENKKYCLPLEQKRLLDSHLHAKQALKVDLSRWNMQEIFSEFKNLNIVYEPLIETNANSFCCNALMFRTLQAMQIKRCNIPYIYINLSCSRGAVAGFSNFNKGNYFISVHDIEDILTVLSMHYI